MNNRVNPHVQECLDAADALDGLIDGEDPKDDGLAEMLVPARDLLLKFGKNAARCWCERCERDRFWLLDYHVQQFQKRALDKDSDNYHEAAEPIIDAIFAEVILRHPTGIARMLYEALTAVYVGDLKEADDLLHELYADERNVIEGLCDIISEDGVQPGASPCELERCDHCDLPKAEGTHGSKEDECTRPTPPSL